jgi:myxalamid-type polyketide synthase MxaB
VRALDPAAALDALGLLLRQGTAGAVGVLDVDWGRLASQVGARPAAVLEHLLCADGQAADAGSVDAASLPPFRQVLDGTPALERPAALVQFVRQQLATVMGVADSQQIDPREPLFSMGLDSLMALELTALLEQQLGVRLTESLVFEHPTVELLARYFLHDVLFAGDHLESNGGESSTRDGDTPAAWSEAVDTVAALSSEEVLQQLRGLH